MIAVYEEAARHAIHLHARFMQSISVQSKLCLSAGFMFEHSAAKQIAYIVIKYNCYAAKHWRRITWNE